MNQLIGRNPTSIPVRAILARLTKSVVEGTQFGRKIFADAGANFSSTNLDMKKKDLVTSIKTAEGRIVDIQNAQISSPV